MLSVKCVIIKVGGIDKHFQVYLIRPEHILGLFERLYKNYITFQMNFYEQNHFEDIWRILQNVCRRYINAKKKSEKTYYL